MFYEYLENTYLGKGVRKSVTSVLNIKRTAQKLTHTKYQIIPSNSRHVKNVIRIPTVDRKILIVCSEFLTQASHFDFR